MVKHYKQEKTMTPEQKQQIESMTHEELCKLWRFADDENPLMQGDAGDLVAKRLVRFGGFTPEISKKLGWGE
jgi:hypothetical protein